VAIISTSWFCYALKLSSVRKSLIFFDIYGMIKLFQA